MIRGENLVILENFVVDFGDYAQFHPGGKFLLEKNRGRDITKYYYGGAAMLNSEDNANLHRHSYQADTQVAQMIIGHLSGQRERGVTVNIAKAH